MESEMVFDMMGSAGTPETSVASSVWPGQTPPEGDTVAGQAVTVWGGTTGALPESAGPLCSPVGSQATWVVDGASGDQGPGPEEHRASEQTWGNHAPASACPSLICKGGS